MIIIRIVVEVIPKNKRFDIRDELYQQLKSKIMTLFSKSEELKTLISDYHQSQNKGHITGGGETVQSHRNSRLINHIITRSDSAKLVLPLNGERATLNAEQAIPSQAIANDLSIYREHRSYETNNQLSSKVSTQPNMGSISCPELHDILDRMAAKILFIDLRPYEQYLQGHMKWRSALFNDELTCGGLINILPDWIVENVTTSVLEDKLSRYGSVIESKLLKGIKHVEMIVIYDFCSRKSNRPVIFNDLAKAISIQSNVSPVALMGGYEAWNYFVVSSNTLFIHDWIETGQGIGIHRLVNKNKNLEMKTSELIPQNNCSRFVNSNTDSIKFLSDIQEQSKQDISQKLSIPMQNTLSSITTQNPKLPEKSFDDPFFTFGRQSSSSKEVNNLLKQSKNLNLHDSPNDYYDRQENRANLSSKPLIALPKFNAIQSKQKSDIDMKHTSQEYSNATFTEINVSYPKLTSRSSDKLTEKNIGFNHITSNSDKANLFQSKLYPCGEIMDQSHLPRLSDSFASNKQQNPRQTPFQNSHISQEIVYPEPHSSRPSIPPRPNLNIPSQVIHRPLYNYSESQSSIEYTQHTQHNQNRYLLAVPPTASRNVAPLIPPKPAIENHMTGSRTESPRYRRYSSAIPPPPIQLTFGVSGLRNLGNTCFMNSIIQCLSATIPLARYFLSGQYRRHISIDNPLSSKGRITEAYATLIRSMWSREEAVIVPSKFKAVIGSVHPSFGGNEQQDSQEFLSFILDQLHEDLNIARRPFPPNGPDLDSENFSESEFIEIEWKKYRSRNWSIIVDMFQGTLKSMLQCLFCGKTSTTYNPFMYLTLPIPPKNRAGLKGGAVHLSDCLAQFLEQEILKDDDAWFCPRCKTKRETSKKLSIVKLPTVLLIHLKRFSFEGPFRNKIETEVSFPINMLNMMQYSELSVNSLPQLYNLYAVSVFIIYEDHFGGLSGGHYTAQVKNYHKNIWYNLDDSRASEKFEQNIQSTAAYILFYVRSSSHEMKDWWKGDPEMY